MALRCLLFSSDEESVEPIRRVLEGLGVEAEFCSEASAAVDKTARQSFQIVIIDWDRQPEAGHLLATAHERKAVERPLTLAIVSEDSSVPEALQAGANSILRKPIQVNQVKDTLTTARDLLRSKHEGASSAARAAAAGASANSSLPPAPAAPAPSAPAAPGEEVLQPVSAAPKPSFVPRSHSPEFLTALEPVVSPEPPVISPPIPEAEVVPAPPPTREDAHRGLEWYLKTRVAPAPTPTQPSASEKPELLGFELAPARPVPSPSSKQEEAVRHPAPQPSPQQTAPQDRNKEDRKKKEAELFSYMEHGTPGPGDASRPGSRIGKKAIIGALGLAALAIAAAPQAPWHPKVRELLSRAQQSAHAWWNPQLATPTQAPAAHEDFGRPGDEYKMPVSESIPDATTDPAQIQVVPVIDPTLKKPNPDVASPDPTAIPVDAVAPSTPGSDPTAPEKQPSSVAPSTGPATTPTAAPPTPAPTVVAASPGHADPFSPQPASPGPSFIARPAPTPSQPRQPMTANGVPSSLTSHMASMTPEASGNRAPETALPSIEPVVVPESAERALLTDQPAIAYPANVRGQQGSVVLQVLIARDGSVQDAKFLQGSLAFARPAIDGVKQWKFKPYNMNGRPVSVQTQLTLVFKPKP